VGYADIYLFIPPVLSPSSPPDLLRACDYIVLRCFTMDASLLTETFAMFYLSAIGLAYLAWKLRDKYTGTLARVGQNCG